MIFLKRLRLITICATIGILWICAGAAGAASYSVTGLGGIAEGWGCQPLAINNTGMVTGYAPDDTGVPHAFLYEDGVMTDLGTVGGPGRSAYGMDINDASKVVGHGDVLVGDRTLSHAFIHSGGSMTDLGTFGYEQASGFGLNDTDQIVGLITLSWDPYVEHAFLYDDGVLTDLGTLGGEDSRAYAINDSGQVVGNADISTGVRHAFLYSGGVMTDIGTLGGNTASARSINDAGQIAGYSQTDAGQVHAFLYSGGTFEDLGTLGGLYSLAYALDESGDVVGTSRTAAGDYHAFLFRDGVMYDLNDLIPADSSWLLTYAYGINNRGQIVGIGSNGGFLLTPVPEPISFIFYGTGLAGVLAFVLRKRLRAR